MFKVEVKKNIQFKIQIWNTEIFESKKMKRGLKVNDIQVVFGTSSVWIWASRWAIELSAAASCTLKNEYAFEISDKYKDPNREKKLK